MKALKIVAALLIFLLPCLYYNPSGVVSVGHRVAEVVELSYLSLVDDISKIGN